MDIDVAVALDPGVVGDPVVAVAEEYYVSEDMVRDAVVRHSSFNLIHFATGMKVDVFPLSDDPLDVRQLERRERVDVAPGVAIWVGAPDALTGPANKASPSRSSWSKPSITATS